MLKKSLCGYSPLNFKEIEGNIKDHVASPLLICRSYLKLDARNKPFRIYGGEDNIIKF